MILRNLRVEALRGYARLSVDVVHEKAAVPTIVPFYDLPLEHEDKLVPSYEPFLLAAFQSAQMHGEDRVLVDGPVCPILVKGLHHVLAWHKAWYGSRMRADRPLAIEGPTRIASAPTEGRASAIFLSGGVDSMYSLYANQMHVPASHPARIRYALFVEGFDLRNPESIVANRERVRALAEECGLEFIPVRSNLPALETDTPYWVERAGGAGFCSIAHLMRDSIARCYFASSMDLPNLIPWTLHPSTDQWYSSVDVEICHDALEITRVEKVARMARWNVAQRRLRVCFESSAAAANCCRCEKCIRTMLAFEAAGALADVPAFPHRELSVERIANLRFRMRPVVKYYREMVEPLRRAGRTDLADAILRAIAESEGYLAWREGRTFKGRIRRTIRRFGPKL